MGHGLPVPRHVGDVRFARVGRLAAVLLATAIACRSSAPTVAELRVSPSNQAFLDTLTHRTFDLFWETANPLNGLTPDRWPTMSFSSIAAVGFALTAYPIGVERGYVTRAQAAERTLAPLRCFSPA